MGIDVSNVTVRFGGITALSGVSVWLSPGRIVAVIGANGSGKSTLFNSITGLVPVADGSIRIDDQEVIRIPPHRRIASGSPAPSRPRGSIRVSRSKRRSCAASIPWRVAASCARCCTRRARPGRSGTSAANATASWHFLNSTSFAPCPWASCRWGQVRLVEVARSVANKPKYLLLDEPAAGLTRVEQELLSAEIRKLVESGVGVLLVEHNFNLVRQLSGHVVVLDRGSILVTGAPDELAGNRAFVDAYLGTSGH